MSGWHWVTKACSLNPNEWLVYGSHQLDKRSEKYYLINISPSAGLLPEKIFEGGKIRVPKIKIILA
jgi:hypothetical protein